MVLGFPAKLFGRVELGLKQIVLRAQRRGSFSGQPHNRVRVSPSINELTDRVADLEREVATLRETEKTLRDRQARFQTLANLSPVGVFRADLEGHCMYANAR